MQGGAIYKYSLNNTRLCPGAGESQGGMAMTMCDLFQDTQVRACACVESNGAASVREEPALNQEPALGRTLNQEPALGRALNQEPALRPTLNQEPCPRISNNVEIIHFLFHYKFKTY